MQQTISVLVENQAGVLNRITSLFPAGPSILIHWLWALLTIPPSPASPSL